GALLRGGRLRGGAAVLPERAGPREGAAAGLLPRLAGGRAAGQQRAGPEHPPRGRGPAVAVGDEGAAVGQLRLLRRAAGALRRGGGVLEPGRRRGLRQPGEIPQRPGPGPATVAQRLQAADRLVAKPLPPVTGCRRVSARRGRTLPGDPDERRPPRV